MSLASETGKDSGAGGRTPGSQLRSELTVSHRAPSERRTHHERSGGPLLGVRPLVIMGSGGQ